MKIECTAPGKLILFGEHASSRGFPAIVFAVNSRLKAELVISEKKDKTIFLSSKNLGVPKTKYPTKRLDVASKTIEIFLKETNNPSQSFTINYFSKIKSGFGSSAAVIASTLGALNTFYGTNLSLFELLNLGIKANFAVKGYGSGLDIGAALYGGLIKYQIGKEPKKLLYNNLEIIIGNTGKKVPSGPIVRSVKKLEFKKPSEVKSIFNKIHEIVLLAEKAINNSKYDLIGQLMTENQIQLRKLGVSSEIIEEMIKAATSAGAKGAKLSGAGIGDNIIALVDEKHKESVIDALNKTKGISMPEITIDNKGIDIVVKD